MVYIVDITAITQKLGVNGPLDLTKSTFKSTQLSIKHFMSSHNKCLNIFYSQTAKFADIKTYLSEIHMEEMGSGSRSSLRWRHDAFRPCRGEVTVATRTYRLQRYLPIISFNFFFLIM